MNAMQFTAHLGAFLLTYLVHSTAILLPTLLLLKKVPALRNPYWQVEIWKLAQISPWVTAVVITFTGWSPLGVQFALNEPPQLPERTSAVVGVAADARLELQRQLHSIPGRELSDSEAGIDSAGEFPQRRDEQVSRGGSLPVPVSWRRFWIATACLLWASITLFLLGRLAMQWRQLGRLHRGALSLDEPSLYEAQRRLGTRLRIRRTVSLWCSPELDTPLAAGLLRPFVILPATRDTPASPSEREAMLAHELAHIAQRDAWWNFLGQVSCRVCFFQPLGWIAVREMRLQMEFAADSLAASALGEPTALARCLLHFGETLTQANPARSLGLSSGMAELDSLLGRRVAALLACESPARPTALGVRTIMLAVTLFGCQSVALLAPRVVADFPSFSHPDTPLSASTSRSAPMNRNLASLVILTGLSVPAAADDQAQADKPASTPKVVSLKSTPDELPAGMRRFNGMLVGRVAAKDVERGSFTVLVDAVPRVWENSAAENPQSIVGKTIEIAGVFGKFLDVLVVTRVGETIEFECKHDGERLVFPGELLRKVAPYDPSDYPTLPEAFRGFQGLVTAEVIKKDPETFELIIRVDAVIKTWDKNRAKDATVIVGKNLMLAGFWNRRDAYHALKPGDKIEVGMRHIGLRSDHLTVAESVRKLGEQSDRAPATPRRESERDERAEREGLPEGQSGFRGMLVGRLVEKDIERGTFTISVDAVPRVWENNRARNPKLLLGKNVTAEGVAGKMIDALVVTKIGDTIEFGALHEEGPRVRVGEVLHKVAPVKPGDYPVLPDDFRGFRGVVTAKVIRKGDELWELIVQIETIEETFPGNKASRPEVMVGKQAMLAGFWNRKDDFHALRVGDTIRCGMSHTQVLSDHLTVIESLRKVEK